MDEFKKSSFSDNHFGMCVYVSMFDTIVKVRKNSCGCTLEFSSDEWKTFIRGVKNGEFDL